MLRTVTRARDALRALTLQQHGVDGRAIYLYGEVRPVLLLEPPGFHPGVDPSLTPG